MMIFDGVNNFRYRRMVRLLDGKRFKIQACPLTSKVCEGHLTFDKRLVNLAPNIFITTYYVMAFKNKILKFRKLFTIHIRHGKHVT